MTEHEHAFSRSGHSDSAKRTSRIEIPVTEEFRNKVSALATLRNLSLAEYSREVLERNVLGDFAIAQRVIHGAPDSNPTNMG